MERALCIVFVGFYEEYSFAPAFYSNVVLFGFMCSRTGVVGCFCGFRDGFERLYMDL